MNLNKMNFIFLIILFYLKEMKNVCFDSNCLTCFDRLLIFLHFMLIKLNLF